MADSIDEAVAALWAIERTIAKLVAQVQDTNRRLDSISVVISELAEVARERGSDAQ